MPEDPIALLRSLPTFRAVDQRVLNRRLTDAEVECVRLRARLANARLKRSNARASAQESERLSVQVGSRVVAAQAGLDDERRIHALAVAAVISESQVEADRIIAVARMEAASLRTALADLLDQLRADVPEESERELTRPRAIIRAESVGVPSRDATLAG